MCTEQISNKRRCARARVAREVFLGRYLRALLLIGIVARVKAYERHAVKPSAKSIGCRISLHASQSYVQA